MKRIFLWLFSALFLLSACSQQAKQEVAQEATQEATQTVKDVVSSETSTYTVDKSSLPADAPTYLVATIQSFPPFVMRNEVGTYEGFDVDVMDAIGVQQGFRVNFLPQPWATALPSLDTDERDIVATGVVITPERKEKYDFSDPYLDTGWLAVMKEQSGKAKITSFNDVFSDPKTIFVTQADAAGVPELKKHLADKPNTIKEVDSQYLEIKSVLAGEADVAFDIERVLQYYVVSAGDKGLYGITDPAAQRDEFGFAVKKGRPDDLLKKINAGLAAIKADGTYQKIYEKWYGKD